MGKAFLAATSIQLVFFFALYLGHSVEIAGSTLLYTSLAATFLSVCVCSLTAKSNNLLVGTAFYFLIPIFHIASNFLFVILGLHTDVGRVNFELVLELYFLEFYLNFLAGILGLAIGTTLAARKVWLIISPSS
jgi:hypothetical protein